MRLKAGRHRDPCGRRPDLLLKPRLLHPPADDGRAASAAGIPAGLVRMSCGLESKQDLMDDIAQALEQVK